MKAKPNAADGRQYPSTSGPDVPPYTPGPINEAAARRHFLRGEGLRIGGNRLFVVVIVLLAICLTQAITFFVLLPLKTVQTTLLHESESGRIAADAVPLGAYVPDHAAVTYFLNDWADNVFDINSSVINDRLHTAGSMVVGDAVDQLKALVAQQNPLLRLHDHPYLRRTYTKLSANFVHDDTVLLRYKLSELTAPGANVTESIWVITITFTRIPPHTQEELDRNPAGIFITSFNNVQESGQ